MKKIKLFQSVFAIIMLSLIVVPSITPFFADSVEGTWYGERKKILYGTMYTVCDKTTKETNDDHIAFECQDVYPTSGLIDTYSRMQVNVANSTSTRSLSDVYVLRENVGICLLDLKENCDAGDVIRVRVRGNDPEKEAYADFIYNPM